MGTDRFGYGFGGTGKKSNNKQFDDYGTSFGLNDVIGCALDLDNRLVSFYKNGEDLGNGNKIAWRSKLERFLAKVEGHFSVLYITFKSYLIIIINCFNFLKINNM